MRYQRMISNISADRGSFDPEHRYRYADEFARRPSPDTDPAALDRGWQMVAWLLADGATAIHITETSYAARIPAAYYFSRAAMVEYLPHWKYYEVGEFTLGLPDNPDMLRADIYAVALLSAMDISCQGEERLDDTAAAQMATLEADCWGYLNQRMLDDEESLL